nr:phosphate acetyltransferase [Corynebacterium aquilae]
MFTSIGRTCEDVDVVDFAHRLGLKHRTLVTGEPTLAAVIASEPLEDGHVLLQGTGSLDFDSKAAAALGIPLVFLVHTREDMGDYRVELSQVHAEELGAVVACVLTGTQIREGDIDEIAAKIEENSRGVEPVMNAVTFEYWLLNKAKEYQSHIVLPEGEDDRVLTAADQLLKDKVCELTILGNPDEITARAKELGLDLSQAHLKDPETDPMREQFAEEFAELRKNKGVTIEQARETMRDISYYATMMIHKGLADGMVSGAAHTTAHTIKPSFQIIKTAPGASVVSSIFLMVLRGRLWAFGDCAVNPNPTAEQLGEIAIVSAKTAAQFGIDPKVAMLSYSTGTSGSGEDVDRAIAAVQHARELDPTVKVDGPLQFDAAVDMGVAKKKMPGSEVAGQATVFIFPDLEAGNIGYKTAQRTGHALAVGPILQGLNKPVNDLSRGATVPDIVNTVAITAIQAGSSK